MASKTTNTSIPSSAICLEHHWAPSLLPFQDVKDTLHLSDFQSLLDCDRTSVLEKAFRFGAGLSYNAEESLIKLSRVCCYVNNLELSWLGWKVRAITCSFYDYYEGGRVERTLELEQMDDSSRCILFTIRERDEPFRLMKLSFYHLTFRLYIMGSVEKFTLCRFDDLLRQQLWDAANYKKMTDVTFQVGKTKIPAHKFILAARSPVFRSMFDTLSASQTIQIEDVNSETFKLFLHFLYTGELTKPGSRKLGKLAEKYQVETLTSLCQAAAANDKAVKDGLLLSYASCGQQMKKMFGRKMEIMSSQPSHTVSWMLFMETYTLQDVAQLVDKGARWTSDRSLLYEFESRQEEHMTKITFYSSRLNQLAWNATSISPLLFDGESVSFTNRMLGKSLKKEDGEGEQPFEVFTTRIQDSFKEPARSTIHFLVHRMSSVYNFKHQLRDSHYAQELWSSVINKEWTDVEFHVGGRIFQAHYALLDIRCPALAALVPIAQSSPSSLPAVTIPNMDPDVFEEVLHFLYTGSLKSYPLVREGLLMVAAKLFKIETLHELAMESKSCRNIDQEKLSEFMMSFD